MRAHLVQLDIQWEDKPANFARVRELLHDANITAGDLVILPEMFDTGFSLNIDQTADDDDRTLAFLRDLARTHKATIHGGRTVRISGTTRATNRAPVFGPDGSLFTEYAKIHPFSFGREGERFDGGEAVMQYAWDTLRVCPAICYDLRFPELFRIGLLRGAEAFALGANWPDARQAHWRALLISRAIENQAFVLGVNRTGSDPHLNYIGGSMVVGPRGEILGELDHREGVLSVSIDPSHVRRWREAFPAWRDIRLLARDNPAAARTRD